MAKFFIGYRKDTNAKQNMDAAAPTPEEGKAHMAKYMAWMQGLGDAVVSPDSPMKATQLVSGEGVTDNTDGVQLFGFMVIDVADMDAAVAIAKASPFLEMGGGSIQVGELMDMSR